MRLLFVHQNFPGQYKHLVRHFAGTGNHEIVFLTQQKRYQIEGVKKIVYAPSREVSKSTHRYLRSTEAGVLNAQAVWRAAANLKAQGFRPDLIVGHSGWGEILFLKDLFPDTPLLGYFEFYYHARGADVNFDPEFPDTKDTELRAQVQNAMNLMVLECVDWGHSPTYWQRNLFPDRHLSRITVVHDGIDADLIKPAGRTAVKFRVGELELTSGDEVVTFVARNLEPYRGFHVFMRALPELLRRRPTIQVLIVGGDEVSYGSYLTEGQSLRQRLLAELGSSIDTSRVHFTGRLPYAAYIKVLQISAVHVYLTYPFVLSWSMLEAMSAGCIVVASATPPVTEFIKDKQNGLLVDFFSSDQIVEAVEFALESPDREYLRDQARQTILNGYDSKTICLPRQLKLVDDLINGRLFIAI